MTHTPAQLAEFARRKHAAALAVFEHIAAAANAGAQTPTFVDLVDAVRAQEHLVTCANLPKLLDYLEERRMLKRLGTQHHRTYRIHNGAETVEKVIDRAMCGNNRSRQAPTLAERLAMWGLTEPIVHPPRPFASRRQPTPETEAVGGSSLVSIIL